MGFWDEVNKQKQKETGKSEAVSFFNDLPSTLVAGVQQSAGKVADAAIQGGSLLDEATNQLKGGSNADKDKRRVSNMDNTDFLRDLLHSGTDVKGNQIEGASKADQAVQNIKAGKGNVQDVATIAGNSLDTALGATSLINPAGSALREGATTLGTAARNIAGSSALFGGTSAVASGADTYGETGDLGQAAQSAVTSGVTSALGQGLMETAGKAVGAARRSIVKTSDRPATSTVNSTEATGTGTDISSITDSQNAVPTQNTAQTEHQSFFGSEGATSTAPTVATTTKPSFDTVNDNTFAPLDDTTKTKMGALQQASDAADVPEGHTRMFQTNEGKLKSDQYFQDPALLANYVNGRADNANLSYRDVPHEAVQPVAGKDNVFRVDEQKANDYGSKYSDRNFQDNPQGNDTMSVKELSNMANSRDSALSSDEREALLGAVDNAYKQGLNDSDKISISDAKSGKVTAEAKSTPSYVRSRDEYQFNHPETNDAPKDFQDNYIQEQVASHNTADDYAKSVADSVWNENKSGKGVALIDDGAGGKTRVSDNGGFYKDFYAEYGKAPTRKAVKDMVDQVVLGKEGEYNADILRNNVDPQELEAHGSIGEQLKERDTVSEKVRTANADITPGQDKIVAPIELKLTDEELAGLRDELKGKTPAKQAKILKQNGASDEQIENITGESASGITQKQRKVTDTPAQDIPLEDKLAGNIKDSSEGIPADVKAALDATGESTGKLNGEYKSAPTKKQQIARDLAVGWDNVTNAMSRMAGKVGGDFANKMQTGARVKTHFIESTADNVDAITKFANDKEHPLTVKQRHDSSARVIDAIENGNTAGLKDEDKVLYSNIKTLYDKAASLREKQGRTVRENYVTHSKVSSDADRTGAVLDAIFNGNGDSDMLSMFSKERKGEVAPDTDLYTLARKYQQGMANDLGYHEAQKFLAENLDNIPEYLKTNGGNMAQLRSYVHELFDHAINGSSETAASRIVGKPANAFTDNVLRFNISNSFKNFTDQIRTGAIISKEAKKIKVSDDIAQDFHDNGQNFTYGRSTKEDVGQGASRSSKLSAAVDKISPNLITEKAQVSMNAKKGLQEGFQRSEVYQKALKGGATPEEAQAKAWKEDRENIERTANYIAGTSSAGNAMQQVSALRNGKPILGIIPWNAVSRFASYPINSTMSFIRNMSPKEARAIEAYARGDVMGSKLADIRGNATTILDMYKNAAKQGDSGIPKEVLNGKIESFQKAIDTIDEEMKKGSRISRGNVTATYAKIWGATTAIQMGVVGVGDAMWGRKGSDAQQKSVLGSFVTQSPFLGLDRVASPLVNGLPIKSDYGTLQIDAGNLLNAIPYVGGLDKLTGSNLKNWINKSVVKPTNNALRGAYN